MQDDILKALMAHFTELGPISPMSEVLCVKDLLEKNDMEIVSKQQSN